MTIRLPPDFYSPPFNHFPETTYSAINRRQLLGVGWDYNSQAYAAEFQILATFVHMQESLPGSKMSPDSVYAALRTAEHRPVWTDGTDPRRPKAEDIGGRTWFHNDAREYGDGFVTRVDDHTLLEVDVRYNGAIRPHPDWLASRKAIARQVVDSVSIAP